MKTINLNFLTTLLLFISLQLSTQTLKAQSNTDETVYEFADEMPQSKVDYMQYLSKNIKYPKAAVDSNIQGTVYLDIIIGKNGEVRNVTIKRNPGGGLGEEAARVVKAMPAWRPGSQNGVPVNCRITLPVKFILTDTGKPKKEE